MLFAIQAFVEDFISRRNLRDTDSYAVHVSNLYFHERLSLEDNGFRKRMRRIKTVFFDNNNIDNRAEFERTLLERLDKRFKKNLPTMNPSFPGGITTEIKRLQKLPRKTVLALLRGFKSAVEARAIDMFWLTRSKGQLRKRPEKVAQGLFASVISMALGKQGKIFREPMSGVGFVDIGLIISQTGRSLKKLGKSEIVEVGLGYESTRRPQPL